MIVRLQLVCFLEQRQYLFWGPNSLPNLLFRLLRKSSNVLLPGVVVAAVFILDLSSDKFVNELDISRDRVDSFVKCAASLFRNVLSLLLEESGKSNSYFPVI